MMRVTRLGALLLLALPASPAGQTSTSEMERAVQEFRIQTENLGLRTDGPRRAAGRRTAGLGDWHGRVFWNFRNDLLDAVPHEVTQTGGDQGILRRNQYGFNLSGPVIIPKLYNGGTKTFLSLSYEGMRETIGRSNLETVPTSLERLGDFSQTADKAGAFLPMYDPGTTRENPDFDPSQPVSTQNLQYFRDLYPGNLIPQQQLDPASLDAVTLYPQPNVNIGPFDQNNYTVYSPERNEADGMRVKLDHSLRERHRLVVGFNFTNGFAGPAALFPTAANPGAPDRDSLVRSANAEHTLTISPNSINSLQFETFTSTSENRSALGEGGEPFPVLQFEPYIRMGRAYPISRTARTHYQISDGLSVRKGSHSLRFSAELVHNQVNSFWPQYPSGRFEFTEGLTSLPGIVNTGHSFGSFMLGGSSFAEGSIVEHPSYFRQTSGELMVRDEWEIRAGLTLSLGLRLGMSTPRTEKYDRQSTVDLDTINPENGQPGALIFAGRNGQPRGFQPFRAKPEGWVSLTWSPFDDTRTVVRLLGRRFYGGIPLYSGQWGTQGFNGTPTYLSQNTQLEPAVVLGDGLPAPPNPPPDLRPEAANDTIADMIDPTTTQPTYDQAGVSIERQIPGAFVVTAGASYTKGTQMLVGNDGAKPNAIPLDALGFRDLLNDEQFNKEQRPYPQYQQFGLSGLFPAGTYKRSEGYIRVEKRSTQGFSLRMVYEYSKQMDDYSGDGLQDYYHREKEWAIHPYSDPHVFSLSYMYELPFGPSKTLLTAPDWKRYLVEGWSVSGMTSYSGGDPVRLRGEFNNTGNVVADLYVNQVPGVDARVENPGPEMWFNPLAFINPPDFTIGSVSRSHPSLRNPSRQNHDLSVTKRVPLASDRALEFMGTAFNFINHANWNLPDASIGTLESPNENAGRIVGSRGGRVIQLGLRLTF